MIRFTEYYGRFQSVRGRWMGLPTWAQTLVFIAALPGLLLMALSLLAFLVSLFALLLLTVPVYSALKGLTGGRTIEPTATIEPFAGGRRSKTVDSTVVD